MAAKALPPVEILRQFLRYEPDTGRLFWLERTPAMFSDDGNRTKVAKCNNWNSRNAGKEAFNTLNDKGYKIGRIQSDNYFAHRVIWKMVTGQEPSHVIDHKNGVKSDNRWQNLRAADHSQNRMNAQTTWCASGKKGVYWVKHSRKWTSRISAYGQDHYLGCFATQDEAAAAYQGAARVLFRDFANPKIFALGKT